MVVEQPLSYLGNDVRRAHDQWRWTAGGIVTDVLRRESQLIVQPLPRSQRDNQALQYYTGKKEIREGRIDPAYFDDLTEKIRNPDQFFQPAILL